MYIDNELIANKTTSGEEVKFVVDTSVYTPGIRNVKLEIGDIAGNILTKIVQVNFEGSGWWNCKNPLNGEEVSEGFCDFANDYGGPILAASGISSFISKRVRSFVFSRLSMVVAPRIYRRYRKGMSAGEIAKDRGKDIKVITKWLKRMGKIKNKSE